MSVYKDHCEGDAGALGHGPGSTEEAVVCWLWNVKTVLEAAAEQQKTWERWHKQMSKWWWDRQWAQLTHLFHYVRREDSWGERSTEDVRKLLVKTSNTHLLKVPVRTDDGLTGLSGLGFPWRSETQTQILTLKTWCHNEHLLLQISFVVDRPWTGIKKRLSHKLSKTSNKPS